MNGMYDGDLSITKVTIEVKKKIKSGNIKDEDLLSENLSVYENNTVKPGYYLITNIFKRKEYFNRAIKKYKEIGLPVKHFKNPKDGYIYVYIGRYGQLEEAK